MLEILNLSCSEALNDETLAYFVKRDSSLTHLDLLMCENITDLGKLKYSKNESDLEYFSHQPFDIDKQFKFLFSCVSVPQVWRWVGEGEQKDSIQRRG